MNWTECTRCFWIAKHTHAQKIKHMQIAYLYREVHGRSSFRPPGTLSGNAQTPLRPEKQREREQRLYEAACIKGKLHPDTENV